MLQEQAHASNTRGIYEYPLVFTPVIFMNLFSQLKLMIELLPEFFSSSLSGFGFPSGGCLTPTPFPLTTLCKSDSYNNPLYIVVGPMDPPMKQSATLPFV